MRKLGNGMLFSYFFINAYRRLDSRASIINEARSYVLLYSAVASVGICCPTVVGGPLLKYWIVPALVGQPFLRMYVWMDGWMDGGGSIVYSNGLGTRGYYLGNVTVFAGPRLCLLQPAIYLSISNDNRAHFM